MNRLLFKPCDLLLPKEGDFAKWSVVACDQFTSEPEYWAQADAKVGEAASTLKLVFPEVYLGKDDGSRIAAIQATMRDYLAKDIFTTFKSSYVLVERAMQNGTIRSGIVGVIDLEDYDFAVGANAKIRPTEKTVIERIPPRKKIRMGAELELPHIILFYNDAKHSLSGYLDEVKADLPKLYDFDLMLSGGHITGWQVEGEAANKVQELFMNYQEVVENSQGSNSMVMAVGDGNHSLATAKACWEEIKTNLTEEERANHPARFAMVELENIFDASIQFEPIHRIIKDTAPQTLLAYLEAEIGAEDGYPIRWLCKGTEGVVRLKVADNELPLAVFQRALDEWLAKNAGEIDYIHGEEALASLAQAEGAIGFEMPSIDKERFFDYILTDGVLPRKTFSIGHAQEKRYYLEARRIM